MISLSGTSSILKLTHTGMRLFLLLIAASNVSQAEKADPKNVELKLPVLSVSQDLEGKWSGNVVNLELTVTHKSDNRPLLVAIAEDRPSGVGEQFRAAIWSAASTVAMERGNPLQGYKLEVTAQEAIDGGSAGAMITLGIMSALDGIALTNDFAFTGSILPNGSVGYVGGVVQKIEAAKEAGKKRVFVPAYYRAEKDINTGKIVDLKEKCRSLGLRFVPVANIRTAYALITNSKTPPDPAPNLELPDKLEDVFIKLYRKELKDCEKIFDSLSLEQKEAITNAPLLRMLILDRIDKASRSYQSGNLASAWESIGDTAAFIEAFKEAKSIISTSSFTNGSPEIILANYDAEIQKAIVKRLTAMSNHFENPGLINPIAAQFDELFSEVAYFSSLNDLLEYNAKKALNKAFESKSRQEQLELLNEVDSCKFLSLVISQTWDKSRSIEHFKEFGSVLEREKPTLKFEHPAIEQLLLNTMEAAFYSFKANTLVPLADSLDTSAQGLTSALASEDLDISLCLNLRATSSLQRRDVTAKTNLYALVSLSKGHAKALAHLTAQTIKAFLDPQENELGKRYGNTSLLQALLQSAREEALAAIGRCQKSGVECWGPVAGVHVADAGRDDPDEDKLNVFTAYFEAALDAKILTLMCQEESK